MPTKKTIEIHYEELERDELSSEETEDLLTAIQARQEAHAPYSGFHVGATIRTDDGKVVKGWNVENIVYDGLHAEGNAIGNIPKKSRESGLKRVTVVGGPEGVEGYDVPTTPCGICRQKLLDLLKHGDEPVFIAAGMRGKVIKMRLDDSLPEAFYPACLTEDSEES